MPQLCTSALLNQAEKHYVFVHSYAMDSSTLFDLLLTRSGHNPNSLAKAIGHPTAQSGFDRLRKGLIKQPKRGGPIDAASKVLGVDVLAFYDDAIAAREWSRIEGKEPAAIVRMNISNVEPANSRSGIDVPLISWVQAGAFCEADGVLALEDAERFMPCPAPHSPSTFALRVRGDSMTAQTGNTKSYPEGSIIYIDPERRSPVNGDRVVACLENSATYEVTFKVYKNEDGQQWLMPLNPMHPPIRDKFRIIGTVIGQWIDD